MSSKTPSNRKRPVTTVDSRIDSSSDSGFLYDVSDDVPDSAPPPEPDAFWSGFLTEGDRDFFRGLRYIHAFGVSNSFIQTIRGKTPDVRYAILDTDSPSCALYSTTMQHIGSQCASH